MTTFLRDDRFIIPRWRTLTETDKRGELGSPSKRNNALAIDESQLAKAVHNWSEEKNDTNAIELINEAIALECPEKAVEASQYVLSKPFTGMILKDVALRITGKFKHNDKPETANDNSPEYRNRQIIRRLKKLTVVHARNPVAWCELALAYIKLGMKDKAKNAMRIAVNTGYENRYVLRSSASLYSLFKEDYDEALWIIRRSPLAKNDPWVMSTEIALSSKRQVPSLSIREAQMMIRRGLFMPYHLSELAGAIATVELEHGSRRSAKSMIDLALQDPTENSLAQVVAISQHSSPTIIRATRKVQGSFEANARISSMESRFEDALIFASKWLDDQPFSPEPAIFSTYIAAVVKDNGNDIVKIGERAAKSNPENFTILNNLSVGYAFQGRLDQAESQLKKAHCNIKDDTQRAVYTATAGLLAYKAGKIPEARASYEQAISHFSKADSNPKAASIAKLFMLREEIAKGNSCDPYVRKIFDTLAMDYKTNPEMECLHSKIAAAMKRDGRQ